jgi:hypothetical protein
MPTICCAACKEWKFITDFSPEKRNVGRYQRQSWCKACNNQRHIAWRKANPEKAALMLRRSRLKQMGLTEDTHDALLESQGGVCVICGLKENAFKYGPLKNITRLGVDHDHKTGKVRGLLCGHCNQGLGKFQDSPELLRKAAIYIERNR